MTDEELEDLAHANANYEPLRERLIVLFKEVRDAERDRAARLVERKDCGAMCCNRTAGMLGGLIRSGVDPDGESGKKGDG